MEKSVKINSTYYREHILSHILYTSYILTTFLYMVSPNSRTASIHIKKKYISIATNRRHGPQHHPSGLLFCLPWSHDYSTIGGNLSTLITWQPRGIRCIAVYIFSFIGCDQHPLFLRKKCNKKRVSRSYVLFWYLG